MVTLAFLNLGGSEIALVLVLVLLLFGIDKAPKMARALGKMRSEMDRAKGAVETALKTEEERAFEEQLAFERERERKVAEGSATAAADKPRRDAEAALGEKGSAEATISPRQDAPPER